MIDSIPVMMILAGFFMMCLVGEESLRMTMWQRLPFVKRDLQEAYPPVAPIDPEMESVVVALHRLH